MKNTQIINGYTLLELMITVIIIGILSSIAMYAAMGYIREKRSEQHVITMFSELTTLRARAIKDNCPYIVQLQYDGTYQVYQNVAGDYNNASPSSIQITSGLGEASGKVSLGVPTAAKSNESLNQMRIFSGWAGLPSMNGNIRSYWSGGTYEPGLPQPIVPRRIFFRPTTIGDISQGILFLINQGAPDIGYAIVKPINKNELKLFKWDGSKWYEM